MRLIGINLEGCVVLFLDPLFLLEWTTLDIISLDSLVYAILYTLLWADLIESFNKYHFM